MNNTVLEPWYGDLSQPTPAVQTPAKDGTTFQNFASGISNLFNSASSVITSIKNPAPGAPGYNPALPTAGYPPPPPPESKPNYLKMGLIGLAAIGLGYGGYKLATRKKKSLSGVSTVGDVSGLGKPAKRTRKKRTAKRRATRKVKL